MATAAWYHRDISRVHAEDLLARAGRDGSYLVRDSESVPGAYALCLLFQRHVHTYRILPDADGLLAVQVLKALQDAVTNHNLAVQQNPPPPEQTPTNVTPVKNHARQLPVHSFQVKMVRYGRQTVSVDVDTGVLLFDRKAGSFGIERVSHDRILQIVKFQSSPAKVRMVVDSHHNTPREMTFESVRKRDAFCQLFQLMKTRHSQLSEPDVVSVFVGTWNMGGSPPPRSLQSWVTCCGLGHTPDESTALLPHDIYALGTQENPQGEREWTEHIKATLRSYTHIDFKQVSVQSLWNMRLAVFVKPEHESRISHVNTASVRTGLGNTLGNKGAVGVSFLFNGTSFGFVNCHLTSGSEKVLRRNQNFVDILRLLSLGEKQLGAFDISLRFTHLFWCGDLNYRLDLDVQVRVNVPSWCDRILWKSYPETHIICTAYGCTDDIFTSDHSPVFATFQVGVTSQLSSKTDLNSSMERAWIELEGIEAIVKTASKAKFFIEFHSSCLEETRRSSENDSQSCDVPGFLKLGWSFKQLPKLLPIMSDMEYLQDQHLLLSVKSCDGFESYGECCVALHSLTGASEQFETFLSHRGEEMGSIRGRVRIHVPKDRRGTREKIYELFCFEKDPGRGHMTPASTRVPVNRSSAAAPPKLTPSSYTNPAYFIFEGVSVARRVEEASPPAKGPTGRQGQGFDRRPCRRSDFTEIEIPAVLPQYTPTNDLHTPQTNSSYQLFPAKNPSPIPPPSSNAMSQYQEQTSQPRDKYQSINIVQDSILPEKNLRNLYMNHSAIIREKAKRDQHQLLPERTNPIRAAKAPSAFPYIPTHIAHPSDLCSLDSGSASPPDLQETTPLLLCKLQSHSARLTSSPQSREAHPIPNQRLGYRNGPCKHADRGYSWEKEVSVLQGAPETVRELLSALGLQKYTLGLSLNGWDDLDYFSGITEEDLRAAGVTNPSHRRRILENLPRNWN
ncbi:Phosphatidylinositol 3,4,5-trisphosphate 5-phosphatase 2B [Larimichthys crocea]|uniref:Uncharacterized protein n=1 Tax=Larimichthys crocea TaxID=215358 RepID=A0ACD3RDH7_LARCR|nr:Phosphatidylinositol 3,4,5-trisphosphate 5-phosphatase 2B [Larimichthys crocea]